MVFMMSSTARVAASRQFENVGRDRWARILRAAPACCGASRFKTVQDIKVPESAGRGIEMPWDVLGKLPSQDGSNDVYQRRDVPKKPGRWQGQTTPLAMGSRIR